jgi:hypothetical protein
VDPPLAQPETTTASERTARYATARIAATVVRDV